MYKLYEDNLTNKQCCCSRTSRLVRTVAFSLKRRFANWHCISVRCNSLNAFIVVNNVMRHVVITIVVALIKVKISLWKWLRWNESWFETHWRWKNWFRNVIVSEKYVISVSKSQFLSNIFQKTRKSPSLWEFNKSTCPIRACIW